MRRFEKAARENERVEVTSERRVDAQVFANPDGTITQEVSQTPIFAKDDGELKPLDSDLETEGSRLAPKVASQDVTFSADGEGATSRLETKAGGPISLEFLGDLGTPKVDEGVATYVVTGEDNESVRVSTTASGFATHVRLKAAPESAPVYRFKISAGDLAVSIEDQMLTFRDGKKVVAQSRPLQMWDADVDAAGAPEDPVAVDAKLVDENGSKVLELRPSMDYLTSDDRTYPVTVDPDVNDLQVAGDTYIYETQQTSDKRGAEVNLRVGSNDGQRRFRSIVYFNYKRFLGLDVTKATLSLRQYHNGATGCADKPMYGHPMASGDNFGATWTTTPIYSQRLLWRMSKSFNHGNDCASGREDLDLTSMFNAWAGGHQSGDTPPNALGRQAVFLVAPSEYDTTQEKRFCSENWNSSSGACGNSGVIPKVSVTYQPELGAQSWYSTTDHTLGENSSLSVNNRNGNAVVSSQDATIKGVGQDLAISRTYNSQETEEATSLGKGLEPRVRA